MTPTITDQRVSVEIIRRRVNDDDTVSDLTLEAVDAAIATLKFIEGNSSMARAIAVLAREFPTASVTIR